MDNVFAIIIDRKYPQSFRFPNVKRITLETASVMLYKTLSTENSVTLFDAFVYKLNIDLTIERVEITKKATDQSEIGSYQRERVEKTDKMTHEPIIKIETDLTIFSFDSLTSILNLNTAS